MVENGKEWRCFYCDEVFTDERLAWEHFGDDNVCSCDVPGCVDPLRLDEKARLKELREAREHAVNCQRESEEQDERVAILEYEQGRIPHHFGADVTRIDLAGDRYKSALNLIEANNERIALLGRLVSEAHGAIADIGWENGTNKPSRWMLEVEQYFAVYGGMELVR